jgi:hypothetical protein
MRSGKLDSLATVYTLSPDLEAIPRGQVWCEIAVTDAGATPEALGLRSPSKVTIRARYTTELTQGRYLVHGNRLFYLSAVRDFKGTRQELVMSASELVGEPAVYLGQNAAPRYCRCLLVPSAPYLDDLEQVTEYKTYGEIALIEAGRIQAGEVLEVAGVAYVVDGYRAGTDDGVVRGLWLSRA